MGSIISIDYGLKRVGIAVSDPGRIFAFPSAVLENKSVEYLIKEISNIILEKEADLILVGMPYNMPGIKIQKGEMAIKVEKFISKLKEKISLKIEIIDERLSSFMAEENLKEAGISSKKSKKFVDAEAARIMLEEYLSKSVS